MARVRQPVIVTDNDPMVSCCNGPGGRVQGSRAELQPGRAAERSRWRCSTCAGSHVGSCGSAGPGGESAACPDSSVSQARSGAQPASRSARSGRSRSFSGRGKPGPATPAVFEDRWKNILPVQAGQLRSRPIAPACPPASEHTATGTRRRVPFRKEHAMDVTLSSPVELIICAGCGTQVPLRESFYVDGAGQLCTANCTSPLPGWATGIEAPF